MIIRIWDGVCNKGSLIFNFSPLMKVVGLLNKLILMFRVWAKDLFPYWKELCRSMS